MAQLSVFLGPAGGRSARLARVAGVAVVVVDVIGGVEAMRAEAHVNSVDPEVPVVWLMITPGQASRIACWISLLTLTSQDGKCPLPGAC